MADYWKSIPRKFCEYCKCWITDNKSSVNFHENGKRHKENVEKKLNELRKKGAEDYRDQQRVNKQMAQMESAALAALQRDIARDPSMAAQYQSDIRAIRERMRVREEEERRLAEESRKEEARRGKVTAQALRVAERAVGSVTYPHPTHPTHPDTHPTHSAAHSTSAVSEGEWREVEGEAGQPNYYWNTLTGAVQWEKPADSGPAASSSSVKQEVTGVKQEVSVKQEVTGVKQEVTGVKQEVTGVKQEVTPSTSSEQESKPAAAPPQTIKFKFKGQSKAPTSSPYGGWSEVKTKPEQPHIDLQLPAVRSDPRPSVPVLREERRDKGLFTEKVAPALRPSGSQPSGSQPSGSQSSGSQQHGAGTTAVTFKKRKVSSLTDSGGGGGGRNIRQRTQHD